ncbi:zinc finger CCHC domain-containing protein 8 homolog isoform X2 [Artemia franciscana]|uniref:PSP proline-rich domain-containing protein n=1 Tax=Artemia franciscana TaxID=6661 RepID=A0AA88L5X9_ARTSF|nr:hypothetical protein QYM36_008622 [Artemia franciscana]
MELFVLDCTPSKDTELQRSCDSGFDPTLDFNKSLGYNEDEVKPPKETTNSGRCFNCGGDHVLSDCKEEKDHVKIRSARKRLRDSGLLGNVRYHEETHAKDQFKPGRLSDKLREALGLNDDELPMHIYQMRILGYPPGWMEELKAEDQIRLIDDVYCEENKVELDLEKIIEYPGFNVPSPRGVFDDWKRQGSLPFDRRQSIRAMTQFLKDKQAMEKHKRTYEIPRRKVEIVQVDESDCVVLENVDEAEEVTMVDDFENESLEILEEKRKKLLSALENETLEGIEESVTTLVKPESPNEESIKSGAANSSKGTPILTFSPFQKLPDISSFAEGIGDHLPFENLPGYEGTYDKLKDVLKKAKKVKKE